MDDAQNITTEEVAELESSPEGIAHASAEGLVEVAVEGARFHVPETNVDQVVRFETPDGVRHEWENPNAAPLPLTAPLPTDDVIYDAAVGGYVPRVRVADAEAGSSSEHGQVG